MMVKHYPQYRWKPDPTHHANGERCLGTNDDLRPKITGYFAFMPHLVDMRTQNCTQVQITPASPKHVKMSYERCQPTRARVFPLRARRAKQNPGGRQPEQPRNTRSPGRPADGSLVF